MTRSFDCADPVARKRGLEAARAAVTAGKLVLLPTDTVYGIGADAFSQEAVHALLQAKGRGPDMPVPVLVGSQRTLDGIATRIPEPARDLVEAFWPGALTVVCHQQPSLNWDLGETRGTVAVRMPLHPVALELLKATGPMAVSSANRTGRSPAVTAEAARDELGESAEVCLDAGACAGTVPSTIVDATGDILRVLRTGAVSVEDLREVVPAVETP